MLNAPGVPWPPPLIAPAAPNAPGIPSRRPLLAPVAAYAPASACHPPLIALVAGSPSGVPWRRPLPAASRSSTSRPGRKRATPAITARRLPACRFPPLGASVIAKTFILAKEIHAMRAKSLRDKKSLRDHEPASRDNSKKPRIPPSPGDNSKKPCQPSKLADHGKKRGSAAPACVGFPMIVDRFVHPDVQNDPRSRRRARQPQITA
jgi:hypothetical protein